jgi:hypothetical protein
MADRRLARWASSGDAQTKSYSGMTIRRKVIPL